MDDYIKRSDALDAICDDCDRGEDFQRCVTCQKVKRVRDEIPAANVAPVVYGRWIIDESDSAEYECYSAFISYHCSNCLYEMDKEEGQYGWQYGDEPPEKYCPNCGAKMDGGETK